MKVVDCHALAGVGRTWADPEQQVNYDLTLLFERGAEAGIDQHCVMPPRNETYADANRHLARLCEKHPGKLIGFAAHSPQREAGRLRQMLSEEVKSMGLRGVRSDGHPTRELLDAVLDLNIPVMYYPAGRWQELSRFYHMPAMAYPAVNFVVPHLGQYRSANWVPHMEAIDLAKRYRNVYVDTSGIGSFKYLEMAVHELPAEKILFGTCAPEHDPRVEKEALRLLKLSGDRYAKVAGANILRFDQPKVNSMTAADFRRIALAMPGASEGAHMGHADFRVGGKIFATLAYEKEGFGVLLLSPDQQAGMVTDEPETFLPVPGGWGRQGATRVCLEKVSPDVLEGALRTAWSKRAATKARPRTS